MQARVTPPESCRGFWKTYLNGQDHYGRWAFPTGGEATLSLSLSRALGGTGVLLRFRCDETGETRTLPLSWEGLSGEDDVFSANVSLDESWRQGLWFFRPEVTADAAYAGIRTLGGEMTFAPLGEETPFSFQLLIYRETMEPPQFLLGKTIYHVFVDRFAGDGKPVLRGDAVLNPDWDDGVPQYAPYPGAPLANNMFFGGNLYGVIEKLDYIRALGVGCIYLSPIFEAYSNHKYDTGDYLRVDEMFGGEEALRALIREAGRRDIRVVLDGVFNHTGDDSRYFNRRGHYDSVGAYQSEASPYHGWYRFRRFPEEYECWWNIPILPRLYTENSSCREFFIGNDGVIAHWAKFGIAGFRLDVADELTDDFVSGIRHRLRENSPDSVLYGEVWEDASNKIAYGRRRRYYWGDGLDGVMNYPLRTGLVDYFRNGDTAPLRYALEEVLCNAPKHVADRQMNLLGTHDTIRVLNALAAPPEGDRSNEELSRAKMTFAERKLGVARLKAAYLALATLPGVPCIYYGDEAGMEGYRDPFNRRPFPWRHMDEELVRHFREVGQMREKEPLFREGEFRLLRLDEDVLAFCRTDGRQAAVTVINRASRPFRLTSSVPFCVLFGETDSGSVLLPSLAGAVLRAPVGTVFSLVFPS